MNYTRTLADYAAKLRYEELPSEVIEQAKHLTLHVLGVALAGCQTKQGKEAIALAKEMGGNKGKATIIGHGNRVSCVQAALANGTLADVLDWEDCSLTGHPSAGAIPAALAVGETGKVSGKDYVTAVVAGYEVYQRIAMAVQPSLEYWFKIGWGLTTWQIFAAAIPAAKLLGLDASKMAQAIGIAAALSPVPNRKINPDSRSDIYHYEHGSTCRDGIMSALIAQGSIYLPDDILDGNMGYWVSVSDRCDWEWMTRGLGKEYLIMRTYFKHWPANMWIQQYLDIADAIIKENKIEAGDVAEIIVSPNMNKNSPRMTYRPKGYLGLLDAQFSIPYCLAAVILEPQPGPNWFTDDKLKDSRMLDLSGKVRAKGSDIDPGQRFKMFQEGKYAEVSIDIITKDGRQHSKSITYPKGHPKNRFTPSECKDFFRHTASFTLRQDRIEALMSKILKLEEVADVSEVTELMHN